MTLVQPPFTPGYGQPGSPGGKLNPKRSERKVRRDWPSVAFQKIGRGFQWLSLVKAPEAYCIIREVQSGFVWKLFVGIPQMVDPDTEYEWAPTASANVAGAAPTGGGEIEAGVTTFKRFVDCEMIAGPVPYAYGRVVGGVQIQTVNVALQAFPLLSGLRSEQTRLVHVWIATASENGLGYDYTLAPALDGDQPPLTASGSGIGDNVIYGPSVTGLSIGALPLSLAIGEHERAWAKAVTPTVYQERGSPDYFDLSVNIPAADSATIQIAWRVIL